MLRSVGFPVDRGVITAAGKTPPVGALLKARNARYCGAEDPRIHAILGRAAFNATEPGIGTIQTTDQNVVKRIFPVVFDDGTRKLAMHRGGLIWEANLAATGTFAEAYAIVVNPAEITPRGRWGAYGNKTYYVAGATDGVAWNPARTAFARTTAGWRRMGWQRPTGTMTLTPAGSGSIASTTTVRYLFRIYDANLDIESMRSEYVELPAFSGAAGVTVTFPSGIVSPSDIGTHLRVYRTLLNEQPGIFFRIDGSDEGIPLASVTPGFSFTDTTDNDTAVINGVVRADGEEGTVAWGEHGGPIPPAAGFLIYKDRAVFWGVPGRENEIIWGALGYVESVPVDFDGEYVYYQPLQTQKQDKVLTCVRVGEYLMVFGQETIFRFSFLPDFTDPAFTRQVMEPVTELDGVIGPDGACSVAMGEQQAQLGIYVSPHHGLMWTNGVFTREVQPGFDILALIEPTRRENVELIDYPQMGEVWVFYTPIGGTANTQAVIVNYNGLLRRGVGLRITWPIDVREAAPTFAIGTDGLARLYIASASGLVHVQDSGDTDAQQNTNPDGDIAVEWNTGGQGLGGSGRSVQAFRAFVKGSAGSEFTFRTEHRANYGDEEQENVDSVTIGPDETEDHFDAGMTGSRHRFLLSYTGPTGSTHEDGSVNQAPCIIGVELEADLAGRTGLTKAP